MIALKAAKGTGKTEWLAQQVKKALAEDKPVIVLTHREQLGRELAQRYGLPYRSELEFRGDGFNGYVLCVDSLHPNANPAFYAERYPDAVVILDEVEQILWHLLNSFTCQYNRPAILETLTALLHGASKVYLSDADLTRISLDYINGLLETPTVPWLLVNEFTPATSRRAIPYESPAALFSDAIASIEDGEQLMIHTGAQKMKSTWSTRNIEALLRVRFPEKNILRIDAESVADPSHPAYGCMGNLNAVVPQYDIVVASPTLETGVSIDVNHFDRVFCFAVGSQTVEAVLQSLARVRSDVPRHIWAKQYSNHRIGNGSSQPKALLRSQKKLFKTNVNLLAQAETIAAIDGYNVRHLATWSTLAAIHNHGFKTYRNSIYHRLESEGYKIIPPDPPDDAKELDNLMKAYADASHQSECEAIANAPLLDDVEYEKVSHARAKTEQERHSERKTAIAKQYLAQESEITPELVKQDDNGLYGQLQILYYLTIGSEFLADRDHRKVKQLAAQTGEAFTPDVNHRVLSAKVKALQVLDIYQFLDPNQTHTNESLKKWWKRCLKMKRDIKTLIGLNISKKMSAIQFAQALLGMMGLKMECHQRRVNGRRVRFYSLPVTPPADYRQTIMKRWLERDTGCHTPSINNKYGEVAQCPLYSTNINSRLIPLSTFFKTRLFRRCGVFCTTKVDSC